MARLAGLALLFAASAAAAEPPVASSFALRHSLAAPLPAPAVQIKFDVPRSDYSEPAGPQRRHGFLAAVQVMPGGFFGIGLSDAKPKRSALAPEPGRDGRRGGKKLALRFRLSF